MLRTPAVLSRLRGLSINRKHNFLIVRNSTSGEISDKIITVQTRNQAKQIVSILNKYPNHPFACDTEVADINVRVEGPIGNGVVTCISIYGGPSIDFGIQGGGKGHTIWVENINDSEGVLQEFKEWFEDENYKKVWHNYGFDRHVMFNEGIDCKGFMADTMHMARLWDTSRDKATISRMKGKTGDDSTSEKSVNKSGYSLSSLSEHLIEDGKHFKISMKDLFAVPRIKKDGSLSKLTDLPNIRDIQMNPDTRDEWIKYSAKDALATWWVRDALENKLRSLPWTVGGTMIGNMFQFYNQYLIDFAVCLTDMERNGIKVDTKVHLKEAENKAHADLKRMNELFLDWAAGYCKDAKYINPSSSAQIQQLLFGNYSKKRLTESGRVKVFQIERDLSEIELEKQVLLRINPYSGKTVAELKPILVSLGLPTSGKKADLISRLLENTSHTSLTNHDKVTVVNSNSNSTVDDDTNTLRSMCIARGLPVAKNASAEALRSQLTLDLTRNSKAVSKTRDIEISTIGLVPTDFTPKGAAQVTAAVLKKLAGSNLFDEDEKNTVYGTAFKHFGENEDAKTACRAIGALAEAGQIETTLSNFLIPLQALVDSNGRVHCSLNLNTETGRLSARRPNLQNQPALEKDKYKIRDAFVAEEGNALIVADYGQLELRVLAHITNCHSMIDAFEKGGCFHSRTAMGMYPHVKEAVEKGDVLLEWDYSKGKPPVPLVKDVYGSERRKAKTLNFSIAYGKTVHGLALDWGISKEEAEETLNAWYADRKEVLEWQEKTKSDAKQQLFVRTMMGRYRKLPDAGLKGFQSAHALRAAINTPIQGTAADIVMMAMIRLFKSEKLKQLKWKLLLQIHDEVIVEGPIETKEEAMEEVLNCMQNPFDGVGLQPMRVKLEVDAKCAHSWYEAK